jgi:hypothetical protein
VRLRQPALRAALIALIGTRLFVWGMAIAGRLIWGRNDVNPQYFDLTQFTQPFGSKGVNLVVGVLSRWDAVWYLLIASNGYVGPAGLPSPNGPDQWGASVVFFPGYPDLVRVASGFAATPVATIIAAFAVSLIAYGVALYLLHRLTDLELGPAAAGWAVALLALFPGALFLGIPYSESLFLALSLGAFVAARSGHWPLAGLLGGSAALTRFAGIALFVPLVLFYLQRNGRRIRWDAAWLLLVPAASIAFLAYAGHLSHDPLGYFHTGRAYGRATADPFSLLWTSISAAGSGFGVVFLGHGGGTDPTPQAIIDLTRFIAFAGAVALTVSAWRNLPRPYGAYAAVSLVFILYAGPREHPLTSALRYLVVVFPLYMELARLLAVRPRLALATAGVFAVSLAAVTVQFARWWFVG